MKDVRRQNELKRNNFLLGVYKSNLGIVADDLTGATTVGALIARDGVEATVLFNVEHIENTKGTNNSAIIVSTDSRPVDTEVAF